ncbi:choice-of-anchor tandem repeat GloVer-containing protein [Pseudoflavitalea rhizosphaerae]|uniref:choice-of-anchor tandem repeat GloVer-containing protein n=1 Tax=Pseudoflavitalea rhizosphaerae TaxID=1884793 RepID=UPI000F8E209B|nr:choice-of-anchor tandem repeat GloVer-containing protein [Pseudoflavitalea rhizosphaerae]
MKKLYLCAIFFAISLLSSQETVAQGIYQFWGLTNAGGSVHDQGTLFSARFDGTGITTRNAFKIFTGNVDQFSESFHVVNGKVYGFFDESGPYQKGVLYEFDPVTDKYTIKLNLHDHPLYYNTGFLYTYNNKLYGQGSYQGTSSLYEYDPSANTLLVKKAIDPYVRNFIFYNNQFYGSAYLGGANDKGYIFRFDPVTFTITKLMDIPVWSGPISNFRLYNNKLYGTGRDAGINGAGAIVEYDPATNQLTEKASLGTADGSGTVTSLRLFSGKLYGVTTAGLFDNTGVVFEYDPLQNTIVKKMDISATNPVSGFTVFHNNRFYGVTRSGGNFDKGVLFEYDPQSNAYTKKIHFNGLPGESPLPFLAAISGKMYGVATAGGSYHAGTFFEYDPASNTIASAVDMGNSEGHKPYGKLLYYQGKLYGFTTKGGQYNRGVIYAYDLVTDSYEIRYHMREATGYGDMEGSMVLYNGRMYGITRFLENGAGALFEFNPSNNQYTVKHSFTSATGSSPMARLLVYNSKLYGTTMYGGNTNSGVLYEFDPATGTYSVKVQFSNGFGTNPQAALSAYKGKLYGTCPVGGTNDKGTIFEFDPAINSFQVRHHFTEAQGYRSSSALTLYNNKFYGTNEMNDDDDIFGTLFEFDPVSFNVALRHSFTFPEGTYPRNEMIVHNKKLYGLAAGGGTVDYGGVFYEFDPQLNKWSQQSTFDYDNGRFPLSTGLTLVPALVAPGTPGSCQAAIPAYVNAANANEWIPFTDDEGNAVMEINPNGNMLGTVRVSFYTHNGPVRKDEADRFYLDRNITVSVENQPSSPVNIRLYIKKTEFETLKNTAGSGVQTLNDITVFKNNDDCSNAVQSVATPIDATVVAWGLDYVYLAEVSSFSSFYFASKAYTALPLKLEYFKGEALATANGLEWKASCTDNADFIVERSLDGINFQQIGLVLATAADCQQPLQFPDQHPPDGKAYYRLQMKDEKNTISYSNIIILNRANTKQLSIKLHPNPVQGNIANFSIQSPGSGIMPVAIYDAMGRLVLRKEWTLSKGAQTKQITIQQLPPGVYTAVFQGKEAVKPIRFIRN